MTPFLLTLIFAISQRWQVFSAKNYFNYESGLINCVKGDDFVIENKITNIAVIKIDVEGFEYAVLSGLTETIRNQKPVIFFEFDWKYIGRDNKTIDEYEELVFEKLGYNIFIIEGSILEPCKSLHSLVEMKELMALPRV